MNRATVVFRGNKEKDIYAYFITLSKEIHGVKFVFYDSAEYETKLVSLESSRILLHKQVEGLETEIFKGKSYRELRDFILLHSHTVPVEENPGSINMIHHNHVPGLIMTCMTGDDCKRHMHIFGHTDFHTHRIIRLYKIDPSLHYEIESDAEAATHAIELPLRKEYKGINAHLLDENYTMPGEVTQPHDSAPLIYRPIITILDSRQYGHLHKHQMPRTTPFTHKNLASFVNHFLSFRKHPHHYSHHHEDYNHGHIKSITGHNYKREIMHTKRSILLLVHNNFTHESPLVQSFEQVAHFYHGKIGHYVKFRILNQRENLTPIKYFNEPTLLFIILNTQNNPEQFVEERIIGGKVTKSHILHLLQGKASYHFTELEPFIQEIMADAHQDAIPDSKSQQSDSITAHGDLPDDVITHIPVGVAGDYPSGDL